MKKLLWSRMLKIGAVVLLGVSAIAGCQQCRITAELQECWFSGYMTSDCWHSSGNLPPSVKSAVSGLLPNNEEFESCYRLVGGYVIMARRRDCGFTSYYSLDGDCLKRVNADGENFIINTTAMRVRYAPIMKPSDTRFCRLWDSVTSGIVALPNGYRGRMQCGDSVFLLENEAGDLYKWSPASPDDLERWPYRLMNDYASGAFHLATSESDGKRYAFVGGVVKVPNSEGAVCVECHGVFGQRQVFEIDIKDGSRRYYVYPSDGIDEEFLKGGVVPKALKKVRLMDNGLYGYFENVEGAVKLL